MKKHLLAAVLVAAGSTAFAVPFDSGVTGGTVKVGPTFVGADYTSLNAAVLAFNALPTGINAN